MQNNIQKAIQILLPYNYPKVGVEGKQCPVSLEIVGEPLF